MVGGLRMRRVQRDRDGKGHARQRRAVQSVAAIVDQDNGEGRLVLGVGETSRELGQRRAGRCPCGFGRRLCCSLVAADPWQTVHRDTILRGRRGRGRGQGGIGLDQGHARHFGTGQRRIGGDQTRRGLGRFCGRHIRAASGSGRAGSGRAGSGRSCAASGVPGLPSANCRSSASSSGVSGGGPGRSGTGGAVSGAITPG